MSWLRAMLMSAFMTATLIACSPPPDPPVPQDLASMDAGTRQAVERAIEFVRSNPNEPRAWMQLGHVYLAHQLAPQAAECMDHLAASNPSAQVHTMHAIALDQLGDTDARRTAIDAAIATDGKHTIPLWRGALWAIETGDLNRAADLAQKAAEHPKAGYTDTTVLATVRLTQGRSQEAVDLMTPLVARRNTDRHAHWVLGRALLANDQRDEAHRHLVLAGPGTTSFYDPWTQEYEQMRADFTARIAYVATLAKGGQLQQANAAIENVRLMYGERREIELAQATIAFMNGRHNQSEAMLNTLIQAWPKWFPPHGQQAKQLLQRAQSNSDAVMLERARTAAEDGVIISPGKPEGWLLLGRIARKQGDDVAALAAMNNAVELAPDRLVPRLARAELLAIAGQPQAALDALDLDERIFGQTLPISLLRVQSLVAIGRHDDAIALFKKCQQEAPKNQKVRRMATLLERAGL